MKRFFGLLVVLVLVSGCDDGNMQVESFDFTNAAARDCGTDENNNFFIYKTTGNEALIVQIKKSVFENKVTAAGTVKTVTIDGTNVKVIYRLYNGPVDSDDLCTTIPPSFPTVDEEWNATGGTIEIVTGTARDIDEDTGSNSITGFNHAITFRNIRFDVGDGKTQTNEVLNFGTYLVDIEDVSDFEAIDIKTCTGTPILFKYSNTQAITLNFDPAVFATLFANQPTDVGAPRTQLIDGSTTATYRAFSSTLSQSAFCNGTLPAIRPNELWNAQTGVAGVSGIIEVTTTTLGDNFEHTITLRNVSFQNPNDPGQDFTFGNVYVFGTFVTGI